MRNTVHVHSVEAGPAGPVLAGPLFGDLMKFIIDISKKIMRTSHTPVTAGPL